MNVKNDRDESRIASGRLFQVHGPATANNLSPNEVCVRVRGASHCQLISFLDVGVRQHSKTKTTGLIITKCGRWIVQDKSWAHILFEVKRSSVKVGVSLQSSEFQPSSCHKDCSNT